MKKDLSQLIIKTLAGSFPKNIKKPIALSEPAFARDDYQAVKQCLDTGWVSSAGKFVDQFEANLTTFTKMKYAVATVNGTAALHLSLIIAQVQAGDEVLVPTLTFVATTNVIIYCRAIPHFVDSSPQTLGVDAEKLKKYLQDIAVIKNNLCYNRKTHRPIRAMIVMHAFGHPAQIDSLALLCHQYKITLIEDAAEALGSYYKGKHVGHWGKLSILSFNGNKIITTGGGGAILTNDLNLAKLAKHLSTTAKVKHPWQFFHDQIGYNYRLPNLNAALGCAQLKRLPEFLRKKRLLACKYQKLFQKVEGLDFFTEPEFAKSNYWLNILLLKPTLSNQRDKILDQTNKAKIMTRPAWVLMHRLPMFKKCPRMNLKVAEDLEKRIINIPSSAFLMD